MEQTHSFNQEQLKEAIVKTVAYFDMFDFPLTAYEIWQYLNIKCEFEQVAKILDPSTIELSQQNGFYYLPKWEGLVKERMKRYQASDRKLKLVKRIAGIFKYIPWLELIAVGNIMGEHNLRDEGDIDLFIITEAKRIWLSRFFCVAVIKFLGLRPSPNRQQNKICLSFFVSQENLDLDSLRINAEDNNSKDDVYFTYWLAGLIPVYERSDIYNKFILANNWFKGQLPNWQKNIPSQRRKIVKPISAFYLEVVDMLIGGLEEQFKNLQMKLLPAGLKNIMNSDSRVVINDKILKLHANDRREEYRQLYNSKIINFKKYKAWD